MRSGIRFGVTGSRMEMWNTGCMARNCPEVIETWNGAGTCKDFIWSKEFSCEFLGGSCHMEELSLTCDWISNLNSGARSHLESVGAWY